MPWMPYDQPRPLIASASIFFRLYFAYETKGHDQASKDEAISMISDSGPAPSLGAMG